MFKDWLTWSYQMFKNDRGFANNITRDLNEDLSDW